MKTYIRSILALATAAFLGGSAWAGTITWKGVSIDYGDGSASTPTGGDLLLQYNYSGSSNQKTYTLKIPSGATATARILCCMSQAREFVYMAPKLKPVTNTRVVSIQ